MSVKLALYRGKKGLFSRLVAWWDRSEYSHCELVVNNCCLSSSFLDGGVRLKAVGNKEGEISLHPDSWDVIDIPWADTSRVINYFEKTKGRPYGTLDLITAQIVGSSYQHEGKMFCSEWCAAALGFPEPWRYRPGGLGKLVKHINQTFGPKWLLSANI